MLSRKIIVLNNIDPEATVEINPEAATFTKISDGDTIRVVSRRGEITAKARVTTRVPSQVVYMNFHFAESAANTLTNSAIDPVAKIPELKYAQLELR